MKHALRLLSLLALGFALAARAQVTIPPSNISSASSAVWATKVTDETGTGLMVFNNSPALITPTIGGATLSGVATATQARDVQAASTTLVPSVSAMQAAMGLFRGAGLTLVVEGDSHADAAGVGPGTGATSTWPYYLRTTFAWASGATYVNSAASGSLVATMASRYAASVYPYRPANNAVDSLLFVEIGWNDVNAGTSAATIYSAIKNYWATAVADGFKVVAFTVMPSGTFSTAKEAVRNDLNALIRSDRSLYFKLVEPDTLALRPFDAAWFQSDTAHLTALGNLRLSREINAVLLPFSNSGVSEGLSTIASLIKSVMDGTGGVRGTHTNDDAAAGDTGEYGEVAVDYANRVGLSDGIPSNVIVVPLPSGGDFEIDGVIVFSTTGATETYRVAAVSIAGGAVDSPGSGKATQIYTNRTGISAQETLATPPRVRVSIASATTIYITAQTGFSAGSVDAFGFARWRRVR